MKTMIDYTCKKRQMVNLKTYQDRIKVYITLLLFFLVKQKYEEIFLSMLVGCLEFGEKGKNGSDSIDGGEGLKKEQVFCQEKRQFAGHEFDEDVQLYYARARFMDPTLGAFISEDPARDGGNWYAYAGNNPLRFVDPSGLVYVPNDMSGATDEQRAAYKEGTARANEIAIFEYRTEGLSDYVFQYYQQALKSNPGALEGLGEKGKAMFFDMLLHTAQLYLWSQKTGENWDWSKFLGGMGDQLLGNIKYFGTEITLLNQFGTVGYVIFKGTQGALIGLTIASQIKDNGLFNLVDSAALDIVNYIKNNPEEVAGRTTSEIIQSILIAKGVAKLGEISKGMSLVDDAAGGGQNLLEAPNTIKHHIFNKFRGNSPASAKYRAFFKKHGISIDDFTVQIPESMHKNWIHRAGNNWTTKWKTWIDANPGATTIQVYQYGGQLMDKFGLSGLQLVPYK